MKNIQETLTGTDYNFFVITDVEVQGYENHKDAVEGKEAAENQNKSLGIKDGIVEMISRQEAEIKYL